jgi:hypothetical protein
VSPVRAARWVAAAAGLAVVAELLCRAVGLHEPVVYERTGYGYRAAPNQALTRFGNHVEYNAQGLRSGPITPRPAPGVLRVLCVGDSITNGGTLTDQASTYPNLLQELLRVRFPGAEVLNASAGGWALENAEGWLRANGILGSRVVVLEIATHDLFQPKAESSLVGTHPSFPDTRPVFGLQEMFVRYIAPRLGLTGGAEDPGVTLSQRSPAAVERALATVKRIRVLVEDGGGRLAVILIGQPAGLEPEDAVTTAAKARLRDWLTLQGMPWTDAGAVVERAGGSRLFRDGLHPSPEGNQVLATVAKMTVLAALEEER